MCGCAIQTDAHRVVDLLMQVVNDLVTACTVTTAFGNGDRLVRLRGITFDKRHSSHPAAPSLFFAAAVKGLLVPLAAGADGDTNATVIQSAVFAANKRNKRGSIYWDLE
jgi:hypothetical protein